MNFWRNCKYAAAVALAMTGVKLLASTVASKAEFDALPFTGRWLLHFAATVCFMGFTAVVVNLARKK